MIKIILALTGVFLCTILSAQVKKIDSIKAELYKNDISVEDKIQLLNELSNQYQQIQPDTALLYAQQAFQLSQESDNLTGKAWALNHIAGANWMKAKYPEALKFAFESLGIFQDLEDGKGIAQCLNTIANTYNMQNNHRKALDYYEKNIPYYEKNKDWFSLTRTYSNIGRTYFMIRDYGKALEMMAKVENYLQKRPDPGLMAIMLNTTGDIFQAQGELDKALDNYLKALNIVEPLKIARLITYSTRGISEIYQKKGNLSLSNQYAEKTLQISKDIKYIENIKNAAFLLYENHRNQGDYKKSLEAYEQYTMAKDSMYSMQKEIDLRNLQENLEVKQKEKEIELLKKESIIQQQQQQTQFYWLIFTMIVLALIVVLSIILFRSNQLKQRVNQLLTMQRNRLAQQNIEISKQREEIMTQSELLQDANHVKDRIFSIIAHDLRSPFNTLLMVTQYLDQDMFTPEELKMLKEKLYTNVKSLSDMLNNLLLWARQQLEGTPVNKTIFNIQDLILLNLKVFEIPASEKNILLNNYSEGVFMTIGDEEQIDSVIRNLINNAIKFTEESGRIDVTVNEEGDHWLISIRDSGIGIAGESLKKIFDAESRSSTLGTAQEVGSGLGLLLCKDFIENNQGRIWVDSEQGKGTTFFFTLPKSETAAI